MRADAAAGDVRQPRPDLVERRKAQERARRVRRLVGLAVVVLLVGAVLGAGVGFAGSSERIASGVRIAGLDVGGMTVAEARQALEERAEAAAREPVVFAAGGETFSIRPQKIGVTANWDAAIARALDEGDGFVLFRGFKRIALQISGSEIEPSVGAKEAALTKQVGRIAAAVDAQPREAAIVLDGTRPRVVPAQTGVRLDRAAAGQAMLAALGGFERGAPVQLPTVVTQPKVTAADLTPAANQARTALSAPVRLVFRKTKVTVSPERLSTFLVLPSGGSKELRIGGGAIEEYLAGIAKAVDRKPRDARFTLTAAGKVKVVPSKDGRKLDVGATEQSLLTAALSPTERRGELVVKTAQPELTTKRAQGMGIVGLVGSYTTTYGGDPNRLHNVQLVADLVDDHLIAPGSVFSFNETTGERNAEKGFLEAPVIINGELQNGIGGGVCQVSTTVFNAAFEAGLSIETRTNHALYISHYPTGRDATVNYPDIDLKFRNDTGHWLWLRTFVGANQLTVNLYGTPAHRTVDFETGALQVTGPIPLKKVEDPTLYKGEKIVEDSGEPPRSTSVRRIVYDANGKVLYDTTWYSRYQAEPKIVRVGTKERPEEETSGGGAQAGQDEGGGQDTGSGGGGSSGGSGGAGSGSGGSSGGGQAGGSSGGGSSAEPAPVTIG